jgi:hypothetical protein
MKIKYVILQGENGIEKAILFDPLLDHSCMVPVAELLSHKIVAAGFCSIEGVRDYEGFACFGKEPVVFCGGFSITLKIASRTEDGDVIARSLRRD